MEESKVDSANYMCGHSDTVLQAHARRTAADCAAYLLPHLDRLAAAKPALRILDVGCGPGSITIDFARRYPAATVVGVEYKPAQNALERARSLAESLSASNVAFAAANIHTLDSDLPGQRFDVVHAHQVLQHCGDPVNALSQMRAITVPGGIVAIRTADVSASMTYPLDHPGLKAIARIWMAAEPTTGATMRAGALQHVWARQAGFNMDEGRVFLTLGTQAWATKTEREAFATNQADRMLEGKFRSTVIEAGVATQDELQDISESIREWGRSQDSLMGYLNGEIVLTV